MWCVVGLGNPGPRYRRSRHNAGFRFVDRLCQLTGIRLSHRRRHVAWGEGWWCHEPLTLARPLTYMNRSGLSVKTLLAERGCALTELLVVHDDVDLALGRIQFKQKGGDGGHKGIRSILEALGSDRFLRLRIGIGRPPSGVEAADYVLQSFEAPESVILEKALERAADAFKTLIVRGLQEAMNIYHARP